MDDGIHPDEDNEVGLGHDPQHRRPLAAFTRGLMAADAANIE
jgi:hypothetical protein